GNLGIGTTSPFAKLSVVGQAVASYFTATTSTASSFPYASTTALTVGGNLYVGSLNGLLLATNGTVSSVSTSSLNLSIPLASTTGTLGVANGGTGVTSAPSYGQILVGNNAGGYTLTATSSLGITGGSGAAYPFTPLTNYGATNQATTGIAWFQNGFNASSTSNFVYASTTMLSAQTASTSNFYGANLQSCNSGSNALTWNNGQFGCNTITGGGAYPFTPLTNFGVTNQATTGIAWFQNGLNASSTSHLASAAFSGNVGIGTSSPSNIALEVSDSQLNLVSNGGFEAGLLTPFTTSGAQNWLTQKTYHRAGAYAAQAGPIGDLQSTTLTLSVTLAQASTISFYYKVSSEYTFDILQFAIDGTPQSDFSGEVDWTKYSQSISSGAHTLTWTYSKDSGAAVGLDSAWIDNVIINAQGGYTIAATFNGNVGIGSSSPYLDFVVDGSAQISDTLSVRNLSNLSTLVAPQDLTIGQTQTWPTQTSSLNLNFAYANINAVYGINLNLTNGGLHLENGGAFTPIIDDTHDLGSGSNRFKDLYLSGTTTAIAGTFTNKVSGGYFVASSTGTDTGLNVIGNVNSFFQGNVQNTNSGSSASSDWVATANNGTASTHYVDMGINGSGGGATPFTTANHAYLYSIDDTLNIGALGSAANIQFYTTGGLTPIERMRIDNSGRVGIGTTTPNALLAIAGQSGSTGQLFDVASSTGESYVHVMSTGAVGVGSSTPFSRLSVEMGSTLPYSFIVSNQGSSTPALVVSGVNRNGNIGIGTSTPWAKFSLVNDTSAPVFVIASSTTARDPIMSVSGNSTIGATSTIGFFVSTTTGLVAGQGMGIPAALKNYVIVGNGKVQAGMAIVNGGLCVDNDGWCTASTTGRITARTSTLGGADVAEMYASVDDLEPGEIVSASYGTNIVRASKGTAQALLGIVSTDPGLILGLDPGDSEFANGKFPVALNGRVPVKVSNENGPIAVGDPITISSVTGVGMRATGSSTKVVAIALEPMNDASGTVLGFVQNYEHDERLASLSVDTSGTLKTVGDVCAYGTQCLSTSLSEINSQLSVLNTNASTTNSNAIIFSQLAILQTRIDSLASSTVSITEFASTTARLETLSTSTLAMVASTTANTIASSTTFIQSVALAVYDLMQASGQIVSTTGDWVVHQVTATIGTFQTVIAGRVETQTAAVANGLEMKSPDGQTWCVRIDNYGTFQRTQGTCDTAVNVPVTTAPVTNPATQVNVTISTSTTDTTVTTIASDTATSTTVTTPIVTAPSTATTTTDTAVTSPTTDTIAVPQTTSTDSTPPAPVSSPATDTTVSSVPPVDSADSTAVSTP
ncbi:MAG: hypothetical protein PHG25_04285, partial [Candidatus Pacebacteria bacterium]|nr:hypothetical protein [Candidatus Paceibacterota bacterium]